MTNSVLRENLKKLLFIICGSMIYTVGMNMFIVPLGLYSGGVLGIAQIIRSVILFVFNLDTSFDIAGIISFVLNLPLVVFAYFKIGKSFIARTLFCVVLQSFLLSVIPPYSIINDVLTSSIIGGIFCGAGIGLLLRNGGSSGGVDIIGMYIAKRTTVSIGKINLIIDAFVYTCALFFIKEPERIIYTFIFAAVTMIAIDRIHIQNINSEVVIITKELDDTLQTSIMSELHRGVSFWYGCGAYTGDTVKIIYTIVSKYELASLKRLVYSIDKNAFMCVNSGISLGGYFEKRL